MSQQTLLTKFQNFSRPTKHHKQIAWFHSKQRHNFALAGRRGGKTTGMREKICDRASKSPPGAEIFYIGPTNQQSLELMWDALDEKLFRLNWSYRPRISSQRFDLPNKRKIYIFGAEKIRRIRGKKAFHIFGDELAYWTTDPRKVWEAARPALSDLKGGSDWATTPNGKGTPAYDFYMDLIGKPNWGIHNWGSIDNPGIDPAEIISALTEMDERSFRQEYMATWESFEGLAYYNFDETIHIKKQGKIDDDRPVILHFDFNVNPTTLLIGQTYGDQTDFLYSFKKEYSLKNSSTIATVKSFCEDNKSMASKWRLKVRGDAAGSSRKSTTGRSDYKYIDEILREYGFEYQLEVPSSNPAIVDRLSHVNSYLMNVKGQHRIEFDPSMKDTIRDFSSQELDGRFPSDKNNLGHKGDAVGYGVYWDHINRTARALSSTRQL